MANGSAGAAGKGRASVLLSALVVWCLALLAYRVNWTGSPYFIFLVWNLFLAGIPLLASTLLRRAHLGALPATAQIMLAAVWLLFLPNAPYLVTDLIHLRATTRLLFWFDLAMLLSFALTGLVLGYASLLHVHRIVEKGFGAMKAWVFVALVSLAAGYGVYLGRVLRWNSWDIVTNPTGLMASIADTVLNPGDHLQTYAMSVAFGLALLGGYAVLHSVAPLRRSITVE